MSTSSRPAFLPRLPASTFAALISIAIIGCAARTAPPPTGEQSGAAVAGSSECSGKPCGVDCTPEGSDEPFNCNASGACVAAGEALGCEEKKECPEFLGDCVAGDVPSYDADGCRIGCKTPPSPCEGKTCGVDCTPEGSDEPFNCNAAGQCVATGEPLGCE